jgi:hypothetical protein
MTEVRERRRGYIRDRSLPDPEHFTLEGHRFETDGKDLWVTPPDTPRIDRIKVTRYISSKSMRNGYPAELVRPEPMSKEFALAAAGFWLGWSRTADYAAFAPVHLDHYVRQQEARQLVTT